MKGVLSTEYMMAREWNALRVEERSTGTIVTNKRINQEGAKSTARLITTNKINEIIN